MSKDLKYTSKEMYKLVISNVEYLLHGSWSYFNNASVNMGMRVFYYSVISMHVIFELTHHRVVA